MTTSYTSNLSTRALPANYENNCFACKHRISFTPSEKDYSKALLSDIGYQGNVIGGCSFNDRHDPLVIRLYITKSVYNCPRWEKGFFHEDVCACPQCKVGTLRVVRLPDEHKNTRIVLGCSDRTGCRYTTKSTQIDQHCDQCKSSLNLVIEDQMYCECPRCNTRVAVPFTLANQPQLNTSKTCVHGVDVSGCRTCTMSMSSKTNVTDLEIDKVLSWKNPATTSVKVNEYYEQLRRKSLEV